MCHSRARGRPGERNSRDIMNRRRAAILLVFSGFLFLGAVISPFGGRVRALAPGLQITPGVTRTQTATPTPSPTRTPTPTATATPTATRTLPPPPENGGLVTEPSVRVRTGPSVYWPVIGWLSYGDAVYPLAQSTDGSWVMIDYRGTEGWTSIYLVLWGAGFDIDALPEREMPAPPPTSTALPATATPRPTDTPTPMPTTPAPPTPSATVADLPSVTPTYTPSATIRAIATAPAAPEETPSGHTDAASLPPGGILAIGGAGVLLLGFYGWRFAHGMNNLRRYKDGFVADWCPVCSTGRLHLDEHISRVLGVPRVYRTVRCDGCRSVLRETRPGEWRYAVDPVADEHFAAEYNGELLDDETFIELASRPREADEE
jgi:uncharacterized protein YraI